MRIAVLRMVHFASLTLLMVVLCSLPGYASDSFKMGVVDPQIVLEKSKAGKRALDGLKEYVTVRQKLLAKDEEDLRNYEKQIKDQLPKMSEAEKKEKETQFRTKVQDFQKRGIAAWEDFQDSRKGRPYPRPDVGPDGEGGEKQRELEERYLSQAALAKYKK